MRRLPIFRLGRPTDAGRPKVSGFPRDRIAIGVALVTVVCLALALLFEGTRFLTPGALSGAHSSIETCSSCHSKSGSGALGWLAGLAPRDRLSDSRACITCHKVPDPAFNAHSASAAFLQQSTRRLVEVAERTPEPISARAQTQAFPTDAVVGHGLACATCHQEHKGSTSKLDQISNEQCRSCHIVKFDSFDGQHPKFESYPFDRRTRIIYDHASHFGKHYPELARKDPSKPVPETCATCHNTNADKRVMGVAPFEKMCASCHLDQITGRQRVSGPKGIAFLSVPGLDLQTLSKRNAAIGEWPADSEARLTPFMKVMISRNERGRALVKAVEALDLKDLSRARDDQIKAVTELAWETKGLLYDLVKGKASDVLASLDVSAADERKTTGSTATGRIADLTAGIPRDVVIAAQQRWLPNLGTEIANRRGLSQPIPPRGTAPTSGSGRDRPTAEPTARESATERSPQVASRDEPRPEASPAKTGTTEEAPTETPAAGTPPANPQECLVRIFGECLVSKSAAVQGSAPPGASRLTPPMRAGLVAPGDAATYTPENNPARTSDRKEAPPPAIKQAQALPAQQNDELLFPTEEELRAIKAGKNADRLGKAVRSQGRPDSGRAAPDAAPSSSAVAPATGADGLAGPTPSSGIEGSLEPENWAEHGGWYRQDYAISYRPAGHKDKLVYSWLALTGPHAPKGDKGPPALVFDALTHAEAPGACAKCHSVDEIAGKGRTANFSPISASAKAGRLTTFMHQPHFGTVESRGCLACHSMEKTRTYSKSYEHGNPLQFTSNFGPIKKDLCQSCHNSSQARQNCLTCHTYHINGVVTPIMTTRLPNE